MKVPVISISVFSMLLCACECRRPAEAEKTEDNLDKSTEVSDSGKQAEWIEPFKDKEKWKVYPDYVDVERGYNEMLIQFDDQLAGVIWQGELPQAPYELEYDARRVSGSDFFASLTFPLRTDEEIVTLVLGGWGGGTVGISSIDRKDASEEENPTHQIIIFKDEVWYKVRVVVTKEKLKVRIDDKEIINLKLEEQHFAVRPGLIESFVPLSFTTWQTDGQIKNLRWRSLK